MPHKHSIEDPPDPFRVLESDGPARNRWLNHQADLADRYFSANHAPLDLFDGIHPESPIDPGILVGDKAFRISEDQETGRPIVAVQEDGKQRLLQSTRSSQHSGSIGRIYPSPDGQWLALERSIFDNSAISVELIDVQADRLLDDHIPAECSPIQQLWPRENRLAWLPDGSAFYYTRNPSGVPDEQRRYHQHLFLHRTGTNYLDDPQVFGNKLAAESLPCPRVSADGRYLLIIVLNTAGEQAQSTLYLQNLVDGGEFVQLQCGPGLHLPRLHHSRIYLCSHQQHAPGEIRSAELDLLMVSGQASWTTLFKAEQGPIRQWSLSGERLFVETIQQARSLLSVYTLDGQLIEDVKTPVPGAIAHLRAGKNGSLRCGFDSLIHCPVRLEIDASAHMALSDHIRDCDTLSDQYELVQRHAASEDGTLVPYWLVHRRDIALNGRNPTVMRGYGGFGVCLLPSYRPEIIPFLQRGGVFVIANVRGGGEKGRDWHRAATRADKPRSFEDFIAVAEALIDGGYTTPDKLACMGWSNGGLLINAVVQLRPELWRAAVAGAPVTDMLRFDLAHGGRHWRSEYGYPKSPQDRNYLATYSPYHRLPAEIAAPAMLFYLPDEDDRVAPWHGYKMAARWQQANTSEHPIIVLRETSAGHHGRDNSNAWRQRNSLMWRFLVQELGMV